MYVWQKDRHYRSMGEPGNKPIRLQSSDFQQMPKPFNAETTVFSRNDAKTTK